MEKKYKILIADTDRHCRIMIKNALAELGVIEDICFTADGKEAIELINTFKPDMLVTDMLLPNADGFLLIEHMPKGCINILTTFCSNGFISAQAGKYELTYTIMKPFSEDNFKNRVMGIADFAAANDSLHLKRSACISDESYVYGILVKCGIPVNIKGFKMLKCGVMLAAKNPELMNSLTKALYPMIAEMFDTTWNRVERNIRTAIETAYDRGNLEFLNKLFGYTIDSSKGKPTNSEFIAMVADRVMLRSQA